MAVTVIIIITITITTTIIIIITTRFFFDSPIYGDFDWSKLTVVDFSAENGDPFWRSG